MGNSNSNSSCAQLELSSVFHALCSGDPMNNSESCKYTAALLLSSKIRCYTDRIFFPSAVILIVIGTILNSFSLYCFRKMTKRDSQYVYLFALSLGDTIGLHLSFTLPILRQIGRFDDFFRSSKFLCGITGVLTESFLIFPTWIVVILTIERLIYTINPLGRSSLYTERQRRAKTSIIILAIIVVLLSLYRVVDFKGIDQVSVFAVAACNETHKPITFIRNINLMIWTILPECFTLIISLVIVYEIKLATKKFHPSYSKIHRSKYNQATKTVLLISILFLLFHTPTGILIAIDLFYADNSTILALIFILVSRKLTFILYEINLCCKFFIYYQTFRNFKIILHKSLSHFPHRVNSAKLGRPICDNAHDRPKHPLIHYGPKKQSLTSPGSQSDSYTKSGDEHYNLLILRNQRTGSTNLSKPNRGYQTLAAINRKKTEDTHVSLQKTHHSLSKYTMERRRTFWMTRPQTL